MNQSKLRIRETEGPPVGKALDRSHLVQENQIVVLQVEVDWINVLLENLRVKGIDAPLLQAHVHNTAENFKQILQHVLLRMLVKLLRILTEWNGEFRSLDAHIVGGDGGHFGAFESLSLKVQIGVRADQMQVHKNIV